MPGQRQEGGDRATNVQAGRDVTVYKGPSLEEVRSVALDVFRANFLELRGVAEEVAYARAGEITQRFVNELSLRAPEAITSASDPDMQRAVFNAQTEYACSGDEDLGQVLVDLLVDRAGKTDRGIETVVLNEAILAVPKLTVDQRRAIAVSFLVRYTRFIGRHTVDAIYDQYFRSSLLPFVDGLPTKPSAYQHIEYVGAGAVSMGAVDFGKAASSGTGWFTRGFTEDDVLPELHPYARDVALLQPCLRDPDRLQLTIMHDDDAPDLAARLGAPELAPAIKRQLSKGEMSAADVESEIRERVPELNPLIDAWAETTLKNLTLTTVGLAIGHGYWRRVTGSSAPLSVWV